MGILTPSLLTLLSFSAAQEGEQEPAEQVSSEGWLAALYSAHPKTRVVDLVLPGTHDSGSYAITSSSPLFKLPGKWIPEWFDEGLQPNIVAVDFYEHTGVVDAVIRANQSHLTR